MKKATLVCLVVMSAFLFSSVAVNAAPALDTAILAEDATKKDEKKVVEEEEEEEQPQGMHGY